MPPRPVRYPPGEGVDYLCTSVTWAGGTLYWFGFTDPDGIPGSGDELGGHWTSDPKRTCAASSGVSVGKAL